MGDTLSRLCLAFDNALIKILRDVELDIEERQYCHIVNWGEELGVRVRHTSVDLAKNVSWTATSQSLLWYTRIQLRQERRDNLSVESTGGFTGRVDMITNDVQSLACEQDGGRVNT